MSKLINDLNHILYMPYKNKNKQKEYQRRWYQENKERLLREQKERRRKGSKKDRRYARNLRRRAVKKLGDKCIYCGCDEYKALEINHKNGGGSQEFPRGKSKRGFHLDILAGRYPLDELEITCRICNAWHYLVKLKGIPDNWTITWKDPKDLNSD
jgi:hypothetical protein